MSSATDQVLKPKQRKDLRFSFFFLKKETNLNSLSLLMVDRLAACVVCLSERRTFACYPCGHLCLCNECANELSSQTNKCPLCRAPVKRLLDISTTAKSMKKPETHSSVNQDEASTSGDQDSMNKIQENSSEG